MDKELVVLSKAAQMLAEAKTLDEVKHIVDIAEAARVYARAAKLGLQAYNDAAEVKVRAERKAGELLRKLERGHGNRYSNLENSSMESSSEYREVLSENEIPTTTAYRWQQLADMPESEFEQQIEETRGEKPITTSGILKKPAPHVSYNGGENEWYTPAEYIEAARRVMVEIDLDPASSKIANETVGAKKIYTKEDDGLSKRWAGKVWLNPPYATGLINKFISKLVLHVRQGDIEEAIVLVNNATETEWFGKLVSISSIIVFPHQRIKFLNREGEPTGAPLQGQAIAYIGKRIEIFEKEFQGFGWCANV